MRRLLRVAGVLLVVLLAYLALWPVPADPVAWQAPAFSGYAGPHAANERLSAAQVVSVAPGIGPEHIDVGPDGKLYTAVLSGDVLRMNPDGSAQQVVVNTGGRPLGFDFTAEGRLVIADAMRGLLEIGGETERSGHARLVPGGATLESANGSVELRGSPVPPRTDGQVELQGTAFAYRYAWDGATLWLHTRRGDFAFDCLRRTARRSAAELAAQADDVRAAINGRVLEVAVAAGADVAAGQRLCTLEAMKMEHELRAPRAGRIEVVEITAGQQVAPGQVLMRYQRGA